MLLVCRWSHKWIIKLMICHWKTGFGVNFKHLSSLRCSSAAVVFYRSYIWNNVLKITYYTTNYCKIAILLWWSSARLVVHWRRTHSSLMLLYTVVWIRSNLGSINKGVFHEPKTNATQPQTTTPPLCNIRHCSWNMSTVQSNGLNRHETYEGRWDLNKEK